ncbi:MAG TPA: hypothetical protein H9786_15510 [Candidatus Brachybacterium merdavium]|uniref:Uncharacterized protein n=1 Tax=Candidatus Brachybacterium merdavium TaxID=2838513 RepID=A0A9D2LGM6_9MICO|nr:hypothetical protein [Candidatus Brachybacterium merdavium]
MTRLTSWRQRRRTSLSLAVVALRSWGPRQFAAAIIAAAVVAAIIGIATVLIPNPVFARDIPPVWWDYPVWLLSSAMMGMLIATYVRPLQDPGASRDSARSGTDSVTTEGAVDRSEKGGARAGGAAGVLAWFAVGCPVCNKIALLALGYTGALTWFAPFQPVLAVTALILATFALVWRLKGQLACPLPAPAGSAEPISR